MGFVVRVTFCKLESEAVESLFLIPLKFARISDPPTPKTPEGSESHSPQPASS